MTWVTMALGTPALLYLGVERLPLYGGAMTPVEQQLVYLHWFCLFFSPAFLPWVIRGVFRAWRLTSPLRRLLLSAVVAAALIAAAEATVWAYHMVFPPAFMDS
jgi:hypothetical protein